MHRVLQMRGCLAASINGMRFFERSFELDGLGTAALLLDWRDCWHLHGWAGDCPPGGPPRLQDMAGVERLARHRVAHGTGQRLADVAAALGRQRLPPFSIELTEPLLTLPLRWQQVFKYLPTINAPPLRALADPGTDLHILQTALLAAQNSKPDLPASLAVTPPTDQAPTSTRPPPRPTADGSVRWVRAETVLSSAQWVASQVSTSPKKPGQVVIVAEQQRSLLTAALASAGWPGSLTGQRLGHGSRFKPTLQLLHLALRLLQEPLDFTVLMQFLAHSINPLPTAACQRLTERLARTPGTGGAAWDALLLDLAGFSVPPVDEPLDANDGAAFAPPAERLAVLRYWLEQARHPRLPGTPISALLERTDRLAEFFSLRDAQALRGSTEASVFAAACDWTRHCAAALRVLPEQGLEHLSPALLDQLLNLAPSAGSINSPALPLAVPSALGEGLDASHSEPAIVNAPAALLDSCPQVYWWHLVPPAPPDPLHWSKVELSALASVGMVLPSAGQQTQAAALAAIRPILLAQERLTLVLPPQGQALHPLWWAMRAALPNQTISVIEDLLLAPTPAKASQHAASPRGQSEASYADHHGLASLRYQALPPLRRWWQLPPDVPLVWHKPYSLSSLLPLLFNPYQWVLAYPAQLRAAALMSLPDEFTLTASLAHRLVERLFHSPGSLGWRPEHVDAWFDAAFMPLIAQEGAPLLMAGRQAELLSFRHQLRVALLRLHQLVQQSGARIASAELDLAGHCAGFELRGGTDLLLQLSGGGSCLIDLKLAGAGKYRQKLKSRTHLQLALYAELVKQGSGSLPEIAYFVLDSAELLTPACGLFNGVRPVDMGVDTNATLWQQLQNSWAWRRRQLQAGRIEVVLEATEPDAASSPPPDGLATELLNRRYNPFVNLSGWEATP
ncbi:PD-(D/E)XK nuclease family protein [Roseateles sp. GG27B]